MDDAYEIACYVVRNCVFLMTAEERNAYLRLQMLGNIPEHARPCGIIGFTKLPASAAVMRLIADGWEAFAKQTGARILGQHADLVILNRCPQCNHLTTWPEDRTCRLCGHDWRNEIERAFESFAWYVIAFYPELLNAVERRARHHLFITAKATHGRTDLAAQWEARKSEWRSNLSMDPEVLKLSAEGFVPFAVRTANRIVQETPDKVFFNRCPKCGGLARTPRAKQCRFCGNDWHGLLPVIIK